MPKICSEFPVSKQLERELLARLAALPGLVAAYLHGSATKGRLRKESDLDIALLLADEKDSADDLAALGADLEVIVGRPVHLGVLNLDRLIYATEVYQHGCELICLNREEHDRFFMRLLSAYADYNFARREVLSSYLVRESDRP
ncbi:MAG: nucleotidyltransferase domain-containing protein [Deltaproteobacteria bacterium]|nr:nucleotidyltransferase domain-containing protein [Deltaproteobacteria bacterium]